MEDIKLWELDGTQATPLGSNNQLESEELLEDTLVKNPNLLIDGLTLVGRQTPTEGGPLDLLGVDRDDGRLVVFELKRGTLSRDAVAQIIDYASSLDDMDLETLAEHISKSSGVGGIDKIENFQEWYSKGFGELESLKPLRMFLIGLGADEKTERMVNFLAENSGMDISLLTFHGFDYEGKTILAKQVEVEGGTVEPDRSSSSQGRSSRSVSSLENRAKEVGAYDLLATARKMFLDTWQRKLRQSASTTRLSFFVLERSESDSRTTTPTYLAIEIDTENSGIRVCFYPRAIELCKDRFDLLNEEKIPYIRGTNPQAIPPTGDVDWQILVPLSSLNEWETHKERLTSLTRSVYEAWQNEGQDNAADSE